MTFKKLNDDQTIWLLALEFSDVSKHVASKWARIEMNPDRASRIWFSMRRKGVQCGSMAGPARAVRRYLLDVGRWRDVYRDIEDCQCK